MRSNVATGAATAVVVILLGGLLAPQGARATANAIIRAVPVYDIGNAVEVAANGLLTQGWEVFQIDRPEAYYPDGTPVVYIWVKGFGAAPTYDPSGGLHGGAYTAPSTPTPTVAPAPALGCYDYDAATPGLQGPFPGATCYLGTGGWGWR